VESFTTERGDPSLSTLHSTLYCTLHSTALCTLHYTALYTILHSALCTLHPTALYTLHSTLCTIHYTLYTPNFTRYTSHFTHYTSHATLCTLRSTPRNSHVCSLCRVYVYNNLYRLKEDQKGTITWIEVSSPNTPKPRSSHQAVTSRCQKTLDPKVVELSLRPCALPSDTSSIPAVASTSTKFSSVNTLGA
jgi:hypothetical protein